MASPTVFNTSRMITSSLPSTEHGEYLHAKNYYIFMFIKNISNYNKLSQKMFKMIIFLNGGVIIMLPGQLVQTCTKRCKELYSIYLHANKIVCIKYFTSNVIIISVQFIQVFNFFHSGANKSIRISH